MSAISAAALAAGAVFALTLNSAYSESFSTSRLGAVLFVLVLLSLLWYPRFFLFRELGLYSFFVGYLVIALLWTEDTRLAMNTLDPALNCLLLLMLFGALVAYHDLRAVLVGTFGGFLAGAMVYSWTTGFPLVRPFEISYNAIAVMYLFGLFIALTMGWFFRSTAWALSVGAAIWIHIVATTSIKTNLGILLGATTAAIIYFRPFLKGLRRIAIPLTLMAFAIGFAIASSDSLVKRIEAGVDRVALGVEILETGVDLPGYSGFEERAWWTKKGLEGWAKHPLLGNGVEAFRSDYGITSHSTPADLLYNTGLVGLLLFYGMLLSLGWRLLGARTGIPIGLRATTLGTLVCFLFMLPAGNFYYNGYLAIFVAISSALLGQCRWKIANTSEALSGLG